VDRLPGQDGHPEPFEHRLLDRLAAPQFEGHVQRPDPGPLQGELQAPARPGPSPSHRILGHKHEALDIDKNEN
jgi:hypothetical protein